MPNNQTAITIEDIAKTPAPGMGTPSNFAFSPDNAYITYLFSPNRDLVRQLYVYDLETNEHTLLVAPNKEETDRDIPLEEALRRERQRQRSLGITQYAWAKQTNRLLVRLPDGLHISDGPGTPLTKIVDTANASALDPQLSPDGKHICFCRNAELYIVPTIGGETLQITRGAEGTGKTNGQAEFIAQEEMSRSHGYWWAPDNEHIAFVEVDETHIPIFRIVHQGKDTVGKGAQEDHRYPFAGKPNAKVRLGITSIKGEDPIWMDLGNNDDIYLARVDWLPNGTLTAQILNREQTELTLLRFDPKTGTAATLIHETTDIWINLHSMFKPLKSGNFIWASESTGFLHLYLLNADGTLIRQLTEGNWMVDTIAALDEENERIYFLSTRETPLESHLYTISFAGGEPHRITSEPGSHSVVIDPTHNHFINIHNALNTPPNLTLCDLKNGKVIHTLHKNEDPRIQNLNLQPPELITLKNRDDITLHGAVYKPPESFGPGPYPTVVNVYGGPHAQLVTNAWRLTANLMAQYLCNQGILVFVLDNRGSARRGLEFEGAIKHDMGNLEVQDQTDGVKWLVNQGLTDPNRVGIYGGSYGGYMAAMGLARAPEIFQVAVASAPVTHWDGYDTCYTERYMGTPQSNPKGYEISNVMHHAKNIRGKLLLVHGLIDENVHFRHTARLINALTDARKPYDLLILPEGRHGARKESDRIFSLERICDYFIRNL
jgi:dipeptidyl-peptidase-4